MPFQTATQFAVLALCLLAGWLFGLASAPGGRQWKEKYRTLEAEHARYRSEAERAAREKDAHIREIEAERDRRIAALEAERDRAASSPGLAAGAGAVTTTAAAPHGERDLGGGWRSWFGRQRDNLTRINGIDEPLERQLNALGLKSFRDIETLTDDDEAAIEEELRLSRGEIRRRGWREQARALRQGVDEMDRRRV